MKAGCQYQYCKPAIDPSEKDERTLNQPKGSFTIFYASHSPSTRIQKPHPPSHKYYHQLMAPHPTLTLGEGAPERGGQVHADKAQAATSRVSSSSNRSWNSRKSGLTTRFAVPHPIYRKITSSPVNRQ
jgi:hypothetical protein